MGALFVTTFMVVFGVISCAPPSTIFANGPACSSYCKDTDTSAFEVGKTYVYSYEGDASTLITGTQEVHDASTLRIKAQARVHVITACEYVLEIQDVTIITSDSSDDVEVSKKFAEALNQPLSFSMHNGAVSQLCASSQESIWALNIKRGILSTLQVGTGDMTTNHARMERDVTGDCLTRYQVEASEDSTRGVVIHRIKDLSQCTDRQQRFLSVPSEQYNGESRELIRSSQSCKLILNNGVIQKTTCEEEHKLQPFSSEQGGATTSVKQILILQSELNGFSVPRTFVTQSQRSTLLFDHGVEEKETKVNIKDVIKTLRNLEDAVKDGVKIEAPTLFASLLKLLRQMKLDELLKVVDATHSSEQRNILLDAIPLVQTIEGVSTMMHLQKTGVLSEKQEESWLTSLAFVTRPTLNMIAALEPLLEHLDQNRVLAVSSIIHAYCGYTLDCKEYEPVKNSIKKIEELLGEDCLPGLKSQDEIILGLKGIGNAGITSSIEKLTKCYQNSMVPLEIRLQALASHRRFGCDLIDKHPLYKSLTNTTEHTEVRLAAYLTVVQCPTSKDIILIQDILETEEVNQVGSFIWTYLSNIQESSAQWKRQIKDLLSNGRLRKKFSTDMRKYSRNYEFSTFFDSVNTGASVESNIIFTPESYIPRSATVNLTIDLFGETVNVFEIGGRAEGLEDIADNIFGPQGFFPDESISKMINNAKLSQHNGLEQLGFDNKADRITVPKASLYTRVFGNELKYFQFNNLEELSIGGVYNPVGIISKLLKEEDIDVTKSLVFLDSSYKIPTIIGCPLNLNLNGTAVVGVKVGGKVDIQNIYDYKLNIEGHLVPTVAVKVVGTMSVDAFLAETGLKIESTLNTNTNIDGSIKIDGGKLVEVKINVPNKRMDVIKIESQLYSNNKMIQGLEHRESEISCSPDWAAVITGMQVCGELSYTNASSSLKAPHFPLTGPFLYSIEILKVDKFNFYEFKYHKDMKVIEGSPEYTMNLHMDTPNSEVNRRYSLGYSLNTRKMTFNSYLASPIGSLTANGKAICNKELKSVDLQIMANDKEAVSIKAAVAIDENNKSGRMEPHVRILLFNELIAELNGALKYEEKNRYTAALVLKGITKDPINIKGDLSKDKTSKWNWKGSINTPLLEGSTHGNLWRNPSQFSSKVVVVYKYDNSEEQTVSFNVKYNNVRKGMLRKLGIFYSLQSSQFSEYNTELSWMLMKSPSYFEHTASVGFRNVLWKTQQLLKLRNLNGYHDFALKCLFTCEAKQIDYVLDLKYESKPDALTLYGLAKLTEKQKLLGRIKYVKEIEDHDLELEFYYPKQKWDLDAHLTNISPGKYKIGVHGQTSILDLEDKVFSMTAIGHYNDLSDNIKQDHAITLDVDFSHHNEEYGGPWFINTALKASHQNVHFYGNVNCFGDKYASEITYTKYDAHKVVVTLDLGELHYDGMAEVLYETEKKQLVLDIGLEKRLHLFAELLTKVNVKNSLAFVFYWDKDNDASQKLDIQFVDLFAQTPDRNIQLLVEYPGRKVEANINKQEKNITAFLEWAQDQKISLEILGEAQNEYGELRATLITPFKNFENQFLDVSYNFKSENIDVKLVTKSSKHFVDFSAILSSDQLDSHFLKSSLNLNSSWVSIPDVSYYLYHTYNDEVSIVFSTHADLLINNNSYNLTMVGDKKNDTISVTMAILDPKEETFASGELVVGKTATTQRMYSMLTIQGKEYIAEYKKGPDALSVEITTPFKGIEKTLFSYDFDLETSRKSANIAIDVLNKRFYLKSKFMFLSADYFSGQLQLDSSLFEATSVYFEHIKIYVEQSPRYTTEFKISRDAVIHPVVHLRSMFHFYVFDIIFIIPEHDLGTSLEAERLSFGAVHTFRYHWNKDDFAAVLNYGGYSKRTNNEREDGLTAEGSISGSLIDQNSQAVLNVTLSRGGANLQLEITQEKNDYHLKNKFAYLENGEITNELNIKTPVSTGSIITEIVYKRDSLQHQTLFTYDNTSTKLISNFKYDLELRLLTQLNIELSPAFDANKLAETEPSMQFIYAMDIEEGIYTPKVVIKDEKHDIDITAKSHLNLKSSGGVMWTSVDSNLFPKISAELSLDMTKPTKTAEAIYRYGDKFYKGFIDVSFATNLRTVVVKATRSDLSEPLLYGSLEIDTRNPLSKIEFDTNVMGKAYFAKLTGISPFENEGIFEIDLTVTTPLKEWKNLLFSLNYSMNDMKFKVKKNSQITEGFVEMIFTNTTANLKVTGSDKIFNTFQDLSLLVTAKNKLDTREGNIVYYYGDTRAEISGVVKKEWRDFQADFTVISTLQDWKYLKCNSYFKSPRDLSSVSFAIELVKNEWKTNLNAESNIKPTSIDAKVDLYSDFRVFGKSSLWASKKTIDDVNKIEVTLERGDQKIDIDLNHKSNFDDKYIDVEITTPYAGYESIKGKTFVNSQEKTYNGGFVFVTNEDKYSLVTKFETGNKLKSLINVQITSPMEGFEAVEAGISYDLNSEDIVVNVFAELNEDNLHEVQLNGSYEDNQQFRFNVYLTSELIPNKTVTAKLEFDWKSDEKVLLSSIKSGNNDIILQLNLNVNAEKMSFDIKSDSNSIGSAQLVANILENTEKKFEATVIGIVKNDNLKLSINFDKENPEMNVLTLNLTVSARNFEFMQLVGKYNDRMLEITVTENKKTPYIFKIDKDALFQDKPLIKLYTEEDDIFILWSGEKMTYIEIIEGKQPVVRSVWEYGLSEEGLYVISFNVTSSIMNYVNCSIAMEGSRVVSWNSELFTGYSGERYTLRLARLKHYKEGTLIIKKEATTMNFINTIDGITDYGFNYNSLIETQHPSLQKSNMSIKFYPTKIDVAGNWEFRNINMSKKVSGYVYRLDSELFEFKTGLAADDKRIDLIYGNDAHRIYAGLTIPQRDVILRLDVDTQFVMTTYKVTHDAVLTVNKIKSHTYVEYDRFFSDLKFLLESPYLRYYRQVGAELSYVLDSDLRITANADNNKWQFLMKKIENDEKTEHNFILSQLTPTERTFANISNEYSALNDMSLKVVLDISDKLSLDTSYDIKIFNDHGSVLFKYAIPTGNNYLADFKALYDARFNISASSELKLQENSYSFKSFFTKEFLDGSLSIANRLKDGSSSISSTLQWIVRPGELSADFNLNDINSSLKYDLDWDKIEAVLSYSDTENEVAASAIGAFETYYIKYKMLTEWKKPETEWKSVSIDSLIDMRNPEKEIDIVFTSPISSIKEVSIQANCLLGSDAFIILSIAWPSDKIVLTVNNYVSDYQVATLIHFATPMSEPIDFKLDMNFSPKSPANTIRASYIYGKWKLLLSGKYKDASVDISLETPISGLKNITLSGNYDKKNNAVDIILKRESFHIEFVGSVESTDDKHSVSLALKPLSAETELSTIEVEINIATDKFSGNAKIKWNNKDRVDLDVKLRPEDMYLKVQSPFKGAESIELAGQFENYADTFDIKSEGKWDSMTVSFSGNLRSKINDFGLVLKADVNKKHFISLQATHLFNEQVMDTKFSMKTTIQGFEKTKMYFNIDSSKDRQVTTSIIIQLPYENFEDIQGNGLFLAKDHSMVLQILGRAVGQDVSINSTVEYDFWQFNFKTDMSIPFLLKDHISTTVYLYLNEGILKFKTEFLASDLYRVLGLYKLRKNNARITAVLFDEINGSLYFDLPTYKKKIPFEWSYKIKEDDTIEVKWNLNYNIVLINYRNVNGKLFASFEKQYSNAGELVKSLELLINAEYSKDMTQVEFQCLMNSKTGKLKLGVDHALGIITGDLSQWNEFAGLSKPKRSAVRKFVIKYKGNDLLVAATMEDPAVTYKAAISHNETDIEIVVLYNTAITLNAKKNYENIHFEILGYLDILLEIGESNGKLSLDYDKKVSSLSYEKDKNQLSLKLKSPYLPSGQASGKLDFEVTESKIVLIGTCNYNNEEHGIEVKLIDSETESLDKLLSFRITSSSEDIIFTSASFTIESDKNYRVVVTLKTKNKDFEMRAKRNLIPSFVTELIIKSNLLEYKELIIDFGTEEKYAIYGRVQLGEESLNRFFKFRANFDEETLEAKLSLFTPTVDILQELLFSGRINTEWDSYYGEAALQTKSFRGTSKNHITFNLTLGHELKSAFVASKSWEKRDFKINLYIPLKLSNHFEPSLNIGAGDILYVDIHASYINEKDRFLINAGLEVWIKICAGSFEIKHGTVPSLEINIATPFNAFETFAIVLRPHSGVLDGEFVVNYIELNSERIELRYSLLVNSNEMATAMFITTPFDGFSEFGFELEYRNEERKVVKAKLRYPGVVDFVGVDLNYMIQGVQDSDIFFKMNTPFIPGFENVKLVLGSKLDDLEDSYKGMLAGQINDKVIGGELEGQILKDAAKILFVVKYMTNEFRVNLLAQTEESKRIEVKIDIDTPFEYPKAIELYFLSSKDVKEGLRIRTNVNAEVLVAIEIYVDPNEVTHLRAVNPWRSVASENKFIYNSYNNIDIYANLCWDLKNKNQNQIGALLALKDERLSTGVILPARDVSLRVGFVRYDRHENIVIDRNYYAYFSWNGNNTIGVNLNETSTDHAMTKVLEIQNGVRMVRFYHDNKGYMEDTYYNKEDTLGYQWDALRNHEKKLEFSSHNSRKGGICKFSYTPLKHDIILRKTDDKELKFELEYSDNPRDLVILSVLEDKTSDSVFNKRVQLTHAASDIHYDLTVNVTSDDSVGEAIFDLNHFDQVTQQFRNIHINWKVGFETPFIEGSITTNENRLFGSVSSWTKREQQGITLKSSMNFRGPFQLDVSVNPIRTEPSINIKFDYGHDRSYILYGGVPSNREISAFMKHRLNHIETTAASFALRLNNTKLLWSKLQWQPGMEKEMRNNIVNEFEEVEHIALAIGNSFIDVVPNNLLEVLIHDATTIYDTMRTYTVNEAASICDMDRISWKNITEEMISNNHFYIDDIINFGQRSVNYIKAEFPVPYQKAIDIFESTIASLKTIYKSSVKVSFQFIGYLKPKVSHFYQTIKHHFIDLYYTIKGFKHQWKMQLKTVLTNTKVTLRDMEKNLNTQIENFEQYIVQMKIKALKLIDLIAEDFTDYMEMFNEIDRLIKKEVTRIIEDVEAYFLTVKEYKLAVSAFYDFSIWAETILSRSYIFVEDVLKYVEVLSGIVTEDFQRILNEYKDYYEAAVGFINGEYEKFNSLPEVKTFIKETNRVYQKIIWAWSYYDIPGRIQTILLDLLHLDDILEKSINFIDQELWTDVPSDPYESFNTRGRDFVFKPQQGLIEFQQNLPVEWIGFDQPPKWEQLELYQKQKKLAEKVKDFRFDSYTQWVSSLLNGDLSAPPAYAMLVGSRHFRTFDGRHFTFMGDCSYVLSFHDSFSVVVNYHLKDKQSSKKSLSIFTENDEIEIFPNSSVTLNSVEQNLPITLDKDTFITREQNSVVLRNGQKTKIVWNIKNDIIVIELKEWRKGTTGGLFGNSDSEEYNEYTLNNGMMVDKLEDFTKSWMVRGMRSEICSGENFAYKVEAKRSKDIRNLFKTWTPAYCSKVLEEVESSLAPCFGVIDPEPFLATCKDDIVNNDQLDGCKSVIAYQQMCLLKGIKVNAPVICIKCKTKPEDAQLIKERKLEADVVFIVEEVDNIKLTNLSVLIPALEESLLSLGVGKTEANRYAVVGWGGKNDLPPNSRTVKGSVWNNAENAVFAFDGMDYWTPYDSDKRPVMTALKYATYLNFRPRANKVFVLVQHKQCQHNIEYEDILGLLGDLDITLHLLESDTVLLNSDELKPTKVFGVDRKGAYTARNGEGYRPSASLMNKISLPDDQCTPAALETNGTLFNLDHLITSNADASVSTNDKFLDVWSRRVAAAIDVSQPLEQCECAEAPGGGGTWRCGKFYANFSDEDESSPLEFDYGTQSQATSVEYSDETFI